MSAQVDQDVQLVGTDLLFEFGIAPGRTLMPRQFEISQTLRELTDRCVVRVADNFEFLSIMVREYGLDKVANRMLQQVWRKITDANSQVWLTSTGCAANGLVVLIRQLMQRQ